MAEAVNAPNYGAAKAVVALSDAAGAATGTAGNPIIVNGPSSPSGTGVPVLQTTPDLTFLRINKAAAATTDLVAAVALQKTRVYALRLNVAGAVIVSILDGATVLEVFNFSVAGGGVVLDFRSRPYYSTTVNTALRITLSAAVQVDGAVEYVTSV
jgi:hypothetical protein